LQIIFQDPYSSLNPRMTIGEIVREPLLVHKIGTKPAQIERVRALLETRGPEGGRCSTAILMKFSGGQRQRIGGSQRALAPEPEARDLRRAGLRARCCR